MIVPPIGLKQDLEGLLEPAGGITMGNGDGVDGPPRGAGQAGFAAHEVGLLVGGQDGRSRVSELGLAGGARGVGAGGGPVRNYQGRPKFVDCVRMVHLRRDFQAMIDRNDGGSAVGSRLLKLSDNLFWGWHRVADGELSWDDFLRWADSIRVRVGEELIQGSSCSSVSTAATCRHLLGGEGHLWRFLAGDGVEPTNNPAERALRHGVLWRKSSGGTASVWGSRFVSRLLGVVATCRQRGRSVLDFLTSCFEASVRSQPVPSLIRP